MPLVQTLPRSAEQYARAQRTEIGAALSATRRLWRRMGDDFDRTYQVIEPQLLAVIQTAQGRVSAGAQQYVPSVLIETGQSRAATAVAEVSASSLVGLAGDGRPVDSLLYGAVTGAKSAVTEGATARQALASSGQWLTMAVGTLLSDTGRQSESLAMGVRPVAGYVRMLNPPSCSRCVILAGKWYRKNQGFQRHPGCDCRHIPAAESLAGDLTVDPVSYVDSLTEAEQDRLLTRSGAEAWRSGADLNQVVNARRGMRTAQIGGRSVLVTTEGTTRRGWAYRYLTPAGGGADDIKIGRYRSTRRPRLMPETIQQIATDREDYLRLLRANGYILGG